MLHWAVILCLVLPYSIISGSPQIPSRYETEQEYTESPDAKLVSSYPEAPTEKSTPGKQPLKAYKPRGRFQQQYPSQPQQQQYQTPEQYQPQYQSEYRAPVQPQSTPAPPPQYEQPQQNQYESHYINQAKYQQQTAHHHEHRPSTTTYIPIIRLEKTQALDGTYQQSWETGNNIIASENGYLKHLKDDQDALVQTGNYSYTAPDGSLVWTAYTADEEGFKVSGSHIPTPPPIPEEIQRGLQQIYEGIRLQQEAAAREAKSGKKKPVSDDENYVSPENYPTQSDNYPPQYRYHQTQPPQHQYRQPQAYSPQPQQQSYQQHQEHPQTFKPIVAQPFRKVQKAQRPPSQQYHTTEQSQQYLESQRVEQNQESSQSEQ